MAFEIWAPSFAELLDVGARALGEVLLAPEREERLEPRAVAVDGADREDVLVAWLGEAVILLEEEAWVVRGSRATEATSRGARGVLLGRGLGAAEDPDRVVKAVTYHDLRIEEGGRGRPWRATVVLDL